MKDKHQLVSDFMIQLVQAVRPNQQLPRQLQLLVQVVLVLQQIQAPLSNLVVKGKSYR